MLPTSTCYQFIILQWKILQQARPKVLRGGSRAPATSKMGRLVIIVNGFQPLTIITKHSTLDVATALDPPLVLRRVRQKSKNGFWKLWKMNVDNKDCFSQSGKLSLWFMRYCWKRDNFKSNVWKYAMIFLLLVCICKSTFIFTTKAETFWLI